MQPQIIRIGTCTYVPRHIRCKFIGYTVHNFRDCNLNILACDHIKYKWTEFTLERAASNEYMYPLQTFSFRNKKIALWVSFALDLVLNIFVLQSDSQRNMKIGKWLGLVHPHVDWLPSSNLVIHTQKYFLLISQSNDG